MVKCEFYITDSDFDKLCELKDNEKKYSMTIAEYARELLSNKIANKYKNMIKIGKDELK